MRYDILGRAVQTSNPTEINGIFLPDVDDYTGGWLYTEQTFDWKGRPLVTTHQDGTTRSASYSGCGCAGGEEVTLQDEGTMVSSTLIRRKQKITTDVLGRTVKAETYEWDGSTVYSTVKNTYNVLDQVTLTRQYAGSTSSSDYQDATAEYDGYGRLYRQHVPEQFSVNPSSSVETLTYTTFTYNADDTRESITDGRGASTTFTYNNRHLVTQIEYAAPSGITVPGETVFTYDGAGNRLTMTDDSGNTDYVYDRESRLIEETRYFDITLASAPESGNGFKLEYTYGLDGKLATLTDPYSHTFTYARDNLGRLTGVTGTSFAGVTNYASNAEYRAWDTPKALDYGNGLSMSVTFNNRQQPATFEISKTGSTLIQKAYQYYNDGRIKFADDLLNAKFDRLTKYDAIGHVEEGLTGARARGETLDDYANQPYQESFGYDAFGHITSRDSRHWVAEYSTSDSFAQNRRTGWDYDADGRLTRMGSTTDGDEVSYAIDAAGNTEKVTATAKDYTDMSFNGEGRPTVQTKYHWLTAGSVFNTVPSFDTLLIRSSVLGGTVVSEAWGEAGGSNAGRMLRTRVPADGNELANLIKPFTGSDAVTWPMMDPAQGSYRLTNSSGAVAGSYFAEPSESEMDPVAANVQTENPYDIANPPLESPVGSSSLFSFSVTPMDQRVLMSVDDFVTQLTSFGVPTVAGQESTNGLSSRIPFYPGPLVDLVPEFAEWLDRREGVWYADELYELGNEWMKEWKGPTCEEFLAYLFTKSTDAVFVDVNDGNGFDPVRGLDFTYLPPGTKPPFTGAVGETHNHIYNSPSGNIKNPMNIYAPGGGIILDAGVFGDGQNFVNILYKNFGTEHNVVLQIVHVENFDPRLIGASTGRTGVLLGQLGENGNIPYLASPGQPYGYHAHINALRPWWEGSYKRTGKKRTPASHQPVEDRKHIKLSSRCR